MDATDTAKKDSKYYLAKKTQSERTVTSSYENVLTDDDDDDVVDITEDDVDGKDSETDSESYWSAIDEDEEPECVLQSQSSLTTYKTDDCVETERVETAVIMKGFENVAVTEGVRIILMQNGNIPLKENVVKKDECEFDTMQFTDLKGTNEAIVDEDADRKKKGYAFMKPSSNETTEIEDTALDAWVSGVIADEARKLNKDEKIVLQREEVFNGTKELNEDGHLPLNEEILNEEQEGLPMIDEASTFQNFHNDIAQSLQDKTGCSEFNVENTSTDTLDSGGLRRMTIRRATNRGLSIEKCIDAYDVIDQFDVKVSEKQMQQISAEPKPVIDKLHAFAAGVRRSMSFRKPTFREEEFQVTQPTRRTKSDTYALRKQPIDDFVNIEYTTRKEENGEMVKILVVSPPKKEKQDECTNDDGNDGDVALDEPDGTKFILKDEERAEDIGSAHDLLDGTVRLTNYQKLPVDFDVVSLSGLEGPGFPRSQSSDDRKIIGAERESSEDNSGDVFDENKPMRPPRTKGNQKSGINNASTSALKRVSSESDITKNFATESLYIGKHQKKQSSSSYDISSLSVANTKSKSISDDNIFKGLLPFLESDAKKKSLSGTGSKSTQPNKETLYLFTDAFPPIITDFPQDRRSLIANEIFTTERSFVRGLELLVQLFKKKSIELDQLDKDEVETIFSNVDEILDFNKGILDDVYQRINNWSDDQIIGDIFVQNADKFRIYAKYCQNYDTSEAFVKHKTKKKKDFCAFLQSCCSNPVCQIGLTLPSYLITVVQRIPRYVLLLKDLLRKTGPTHPDFHNLTTALKKMEEIATYINNQLKLSQSEKALAALEQQIVGLKAYYFSGRTLVHEGPVCLMNIKRTYQCVLFNDLMVFASKGESKQSVVDLVLDLSIIWFQDLEQLDPQTTKEDAIGLYTPDRPYTIYVGTKAAKRLWLQHIKNAIVAHNLGADAPQNSDLSRRKATHTYKNGTVYSGDFLESKREGEGTMMWPNQMTYRGEWIDDERNGKGVLEYGTGEIYDGEWKNDKLHGYGLCKYRNGDEVYGQWKIGIRHGKARIVFQNGDLFEGNFRSDRIEGEGKLICKNGMEYEGAWKRNMKYGFGKLKMIDGSSYEGSFKNDMFSGDGVLTYKDGGVYRGEFEDGQRNGCGTFSNKNGTCYEGHWLHDLKDGTGTLTFPNGDTFEGSFIEDKRCGRGTLKYEHGGAYDGQWEDENMNGNGVMEYKDGSRYEGCWLSGQRSGQGKQKYVGGTFFDGEWRFDMYHGKGVLEKLNGWKYKGDWQQGKQHGTGTLTDSANEYKFQGEWRNGKKEGKGIEMIRGILYEGEFKNNKRDGHGIETAQDQTTYDGNWRVGQKHGKGFKKLLNGMVQPQIWHMGCLMDCPILVAREIPPLQRS